MIRDHYYAWLESEGADLPPGIGEQPPWHDSL